MGSAISSNGFNCYEWDLCKKYCPCFGFFTRTRWTRSPTLNMNTALSRSSSHALFDCTDDGMARVREHLNIQLQQKSMAKTTTTTNNNNKLSSFPVTFNEALKRLGIQPKPLKFTEDGGFRVIYITNLSDQRMAVKMKCTNNNLFRAKPIYSFLEPKSKNSIQIWRDKSYTTKPERIVLFVVPATKWEKVPSDAFHSMLDEDQLGIKFHVPVITVGQQELDRDEIQAVNKALEDRKRKEQDDDDDLYANLVSVECLGE